MQEKFLVFAERLHGDSAIRHQREMKTAGLRPAKLAVSRRLAIQTVSVWRH
jgi:hypothetical protein